MNSADEERSPSIDKTEPLSSSTSPQPSTPVAYPRTLCSRVFGTSLRTGLPITIDCPRQWYTRISASIASFLPNDLPPRAHHHDDDLLPRELLEDVAAQHVAACPASSIGVLDTTWGRVFQKIAKCQGCNRLPSYVYISPGVGFAIEFPGCGLSFCPICSLIDSRDKVRRYCDLMSAEIAGGKSAILFTLACEQRNDDRLADQYAIFQKAWNKVVRHRSFGDLVEHYIGCFHLGLQKVQVNGRSTYVWRLHFHLVVIAGRKADLAGTQDALLALWENSVRKTSGRGTTEAWSDEFKQLRTEFRQDTPAASALRILKYMFNRFLGPDPEDERSKDTVLPIREWPAEKILEAIHRVSKPGFQRFRASRTFRAAAKLSRKRPKTFRRRRRNAKGVDRQCMKIDEYLAAIDQLTAGRKFLPNSQEILESLPEVYLDACLNECWWLADRLRPLLSRLQPYSQRLAGPPPGASMPSGGSVGA